jgi:hypothetical protein
MTRNQCLCTFLALERQQKEAVLCMEAQQVVNMLKSEKPEDWEGFPQGLVTKFQYLVFSNQSNVRLPDKERERLLTDIHDNVREMAVKRCQKGMYPFALKPELIYTVLNLTPNEPYNAIL